LSSITSASFFDRAEEVLDSLCFSELEAWLSFSFRRSISFLREEICDSNS